MLILSDGMLANDRPENEDVHKSCQWKCELVLLVMVSMSNLDRTFEY